MATLGKISAKRALGSTSSKRSNVKNANKNCPCHPSGVVENKKLLLGKYFEAMCNLRGDKVPQAFHAYCLQGMPRAQVQTHAATM